MQSPQDPILGRAGAFPAPVHEITGSVYGLANAPRLWSSEVGKRLLAAGFRPHALDQMCFLHFDTDGVIDCIALVYVDDFLVTYAETFDFSVFASPFRWGKTSSDMPGYIHDYTRSLLELCCIRSCNILQSL